MGFWDIVLGIIIFIGACFLIYFLFHIISGIISIIIVIVVGVVTVGIIIAFIGELFIDIPCLEATILSLMRITG